MKLGNLDVDSFKLGSAQVDKVYLGPTEVWANVTHQLTVGFLFGAYGWVQGGVEGGLLVPNTVDGVALLLFNSDGADDELRLQTSDALQIPGVTSISVVFDNGLTEILTWDGEAYVVISIEAFTYLESEHLNTVGLTITTL